MTDDMGREVRMRQKKMEILEKILGEQIEKLMRVMIDHSTSEKLMIVMAHGKERAEVMQRQIGLKEQRKQLEASMRVIAELMAEYEGQAT